MWFLYFDAPSGCVRSAGFRRSGGPAAASSLLLGMDSLASRASKGSLGSDWSILFNICNICRIERSASNRCCLEVLLAPHSAERPGKFMAKDRPSWAQLCFNELVKSGNALAAAIGDEAEAAISALRHAPAHRRHGSFAGDDEHEHEGIEDGRESDGAEAPSGSSSSSMASDVARFLPSFDDKSQLPTSALFPFALHFAASEHADAFVSAVLAMRPSV